ncbi:hypothetical protein TKK_0018081 [Trichogramma kaykai]
MEIPYPGGSALIRTALLKQGIPFHSVDTSMASISASTLKSYDASLKKWWYFCQEGELDIYEASIPRIIEFLQLEFNKGLSFSALNGIRSAISLITTADVKDDLRVSRFFRGISKLRPPKPKYDCTWDPKDILDYYDSQQMNEKLDLKCLSEKLLILLAIVTGQRIHTLSLIKIENIRVSKDKIEILIPDPVKTSGINVFQPLLLLPFYRKNLKICPATPLRDYLNVTSQSRGGVSELFLSLNKPKKAVCKQTLSSWVKNVFKKCKIDTSIFSAHSTRHASNSAAQRLGVNIDVILKAAGWSAQSDTFAKFYNRNLVSNRSDFAQAILNQSKN